ncbi:MAG: hypothetical protein AMXMBFR64_44160 [Myxococcales bacterium]
MSHRIPVFFLPIPTDEIDDDDLVGAKALIGEAYADAEASGLTESTSTNWWHQAVIAALCEQWSVSGLEFLEAEMCVLGRAQASRASKALTTVLERLEGGVPDLRAGLGPEAEDLLDAGPLAPRIRSASPASEIDDDDGVVQSFLQFVVSLRAAAAEAAAAGEALLWYRPQP